MKHFTGIEHALVLNELAIFIVQATEDVAIVAPRDTRRRAVVHEVSVSVAKPPVNSALALGRKIAEADDGIGVVGRFAFACQVGPKDDGVTGVRAATKVNKVTATKIGEWLFSANACSSKCESCSS